VERGERRHEARQQCGLKRVQLGNHSNERVPLTQIHVPPGDGLEVASCWSADGAGKDPMAGPGSCHAEWRLTPLQRRSGAVHEQRALCIPNPLTGEDIPSSTTLQAVDEVL